VARGHDATVTLLPDPADPTHAATVALTAGTGEASALYDAIGRRHSNRGPYTASPVATEAIDALDATAAGLDGVRVRWFTSPDDRAALGALIIQATRAIIADEQQSRDSFAWFRNNRDDIDTHRDGLTLDAQGLSPVMLALAKVLPATSRTAGDTFWLDQTRTVHTATAAAYGVITVVDPADRTQQLVGGRLLQRIHLASTGLGLGLQHMNQVTERIDRDTSLEIPSSFATDMDALLAQPGRQALATFRIGHPVRAARLSPRRPLSEVTR
jgi:hypothetical protein